MFFDYLDFDESSEISTLSLHPLGICEFVSQAVESYQIVKIGLLWKRVRKTVSKSGSV
jgi:hypothetical protein